MTSTTRRTAALFVVALALAGCDNSPAAPALFTTETFSGSVGRLASSSHTFITGSSSQTVFTINSFAPALTMGLALGTPTPTPTGEICSITIGQAAVQNGTTFQLALDPSTYCVMIFDIGNVTDSNVAYSLTVQHR
jgi:hypothetical protein